MAADLCLILLPLSFGVLFLIGSMGGPLTFGIVLAAVAFLLLSSGLVIGTMNLARSWENERLE
jgi:hypothetical protein